MSQPTSSPEVEYLTPDQVAAMVQLSVKSVYRLVASDPTMPATRIGGSVRFHAERLRRWLRDREQGAPRIRKPMPSSAKPAADKASDVAMRGDALTPGLNGAAPCAQDAVGERA